MRTVLRSAVILLAGLGAIEAREWVVSPDGKPDAPGTREAPLKALQAAADKAEPGDTILVRAGTYRESVHRRLDPQLRGPGLTLAAFPGERPVITGADVLSGPFTPVRVALRPRPATTATPPGEAFDPEAWRRQIGVDGPADAHAAPAPTEGLDHAKAPFLGIYSCPWTGSASLVFADGRRLDQIGLQGTTARAEKGGGFRYRREWDGRDVSDLRPGSFFHDAPRSQLYLWLHDGTTPALHTLEVAVRSPLVLLHGPWTLRGFDLLHAADGQYSGGSEAAVVVHGRHTLVADCRIAQNEFIGLIHHGWDGVTRHCLVSDNGLCGISPSYGWRMAIEENEFRGNGWRGDVRCAHQGNKITGLKETRILGNRFRSDPGLWLDINVNNALVAENVFENCACGVYFEISCWGVIANNVFRNCGRGIWIYGANSLVAHNVLDRCGEGITVTTARRGAHFAQCYNDPLQPQPAECLFATRNNLIVNNLIIDATGSFVACGRDSAWACNNSSDYNAFAWTLAAIHNGGNHIKFMGEWDRYFGRIEFWWMATHNDEHSLIADAALLDAWRDGRSWGNLRPPLLVGDLRLADRDAGDYRLRPESPLHGRGIHLPAELLPAYAPPQDDVLRSRSLANTEARPAEGLTDVSGGFAGKHYRLQPLPRLQPIMDLDACGPGTPGLNEEWRRTRQYPRFRLAAAPEWPADHEWVLGPENHLRNSSFEDGLPEGGVWTASGGVHAFNGTACLNLQPTQTSFATCRQALGPIRPETEYLLWAKWRLDAARAPAESRIALNAAGQEKPLAEQRLAAPAGTRRSWQTGVVHWTSGRAGDDPAVGKNLEVVLGGRLTAPAEADAQAPVAFLAWDDLFLLSGEPAGQAPR